MLPRADGPQDQDFMRNNAAPIFHSSNRVLVSCEFRHTGPGVSEAELLGQAQPPDVGHRVMLQPERGANVWVFFHNPPASTRLYKLGKGKLHDVVKLMANCLEQKGP